jgi:hypothetical protein
LLHEGGFAGWRAEREGSLLTHPLSIEDPGSAFYLNGDAEGGSIRAELLDRQDRVIPAFSKERSRVISGRGANLRIRWDDEESLPSCLSAGEVRLKLYISNATLYGFRCRRPGKDEAQIG